MVSMAAVTDAGAKITLNFNADNLYLGSAADPDAADPTDPAAQGKWFFAPDGYFYYLGTLSGDTSTPVLLESVSLDKTAGPEYSNMQFNYYVMMEAIQATPTALSDTTGWGLTGDLLTAMTAYTSTNVVP